MKKCLKAVDMQVSVKFPLGTGSSFRGENRYLIGVKATSLFKLKLLEYPKLQLKCGRDRHETFLFEQVIYF